MSVTAWRITKRKHTRHAFTGEGAREFGGRWNNPGTAIVYTAQSQSLAALEMLVHLDSSDLLEKYVLIGVEFDQSLVRPVAAFSAAQELEVGSCRRRKFGPSAITGFLPEVPPCSRFQVRWSRARTTSF